LMLLKSSLMPGGKTVRDWELEDMTHQTGRAGWVCVW
jgi:hypothetical protein